LSAGRGRHARVGISLGTATFGIDGETLDQLLMNADAAMYRVKSNHRLERSIPPSTSALQPGTEEVAPIALSS
jgi:GGDEF domain-containing protein